MEPLERLKRKENVHRYGREMAYHKAILGLLEEGPKSVAEVAEALSIPEADAMMYIQAMVRYGEVEPMPKARRDRYFKCGKRAA